MSIIIIFLALFVVGGVGAAQLYYGWKSLENVDKQAWESVADRLGLQFAEGVSGDTPYLTGVFDDVPVAVMSEQERRGRSTATYTRVSATISSEALADVNVLSSRLVSRLLGSVTGSLESVGDPELDQAFMFRTDEPEQLEVVRVPEVRRALLAAHDAYDHLEIEFGEVVYQDPWIINDPDEIVRCVEILCAVARELDRATWSEEFG